MGQLTYLIWLLLFIFLPILGLTVRYWPVVRGHGRTLALVTAGALVGGWLWDVLSIRLEIWRFDPGNIIGVWLLGLPVEEWLWIMGVTVMFSLLTIILKEKGHAHVSG